VTDESNQLTDDAEIDFATHANSDRPAAGAPAEEEVEETSLSPAGTHDIGDDSLKEPPTGDAAESAEVEAQQTELDTEEIGESEEAEAAEGPVVVPSSGPVYVAPPEEDDLTMDWYILKVQSNRERSIAEAVERKMKVEGLERYFDQVIVPTEKVTEFKGGKKKVVERKLYPGYIVVHMHINDDTWFAIRETSGVGDFTGAGGKPTPMLPHEVAKIIQTETEETEEAPKLDIKFAKGEKVKVKEGNFESFEGEVGSIDEASGRVTVMINIFGRSTPVELEYWQIEAM
jgi:transcription termination/antitermination protein NusG